MAEKKTVYLKQYLVSGSEDIYDGKKPRTGAFILATCGKTAREAFERRFPGMRILSCSESAETDIPKEAVEGRDLWAEKANWTIEIPPPAESEAVRRYFAVKARGEVVQAAKRKAGIGRWDQADDAQRSAFDDEIEKAGGGRPLGTSRRKGKTE